MIDARIQQDIKRLAHERPSITPLSGAVAPPPISAKTALGPTPASTEDSGIASPLDESPGTREYYSNENLASANGLFVFVVKPISTLHFSDAVGRSVEINLES
jgi:hypothetical protein